MDTSVLTKTLDQFDASLIGVKNAWITVPEGQIYIRRSIRTFGMKVLDIANVEIKRKYRGKKVFTAYLEWLENEAKCRGYDAVYIENIHELRLAAFCIKRGYKSTGISWPGQAGSFYKNVQGENHE